METLLPKNLLKTVNSETTLMLYFSNGDSRCKVFDIMAKEVEEIIGDKLQIFKVEDKGIVNSFEVVKFPTLIIYKSGRRQNSYFGLPTHESLADYINRYIK